MSDVIGPALPPHMRQKCTNDSQEAEKLSYAGEKNTITVNNSQNSVIGPALPPWMAKTDLIYDEHESFAPSLPPAVEPAVHDVPVAKEQDDDPEAVIGPLPAKNDRKMTSLVDDIEERSKKMRDRLMGLEKPKKLEREEWMTELPPLLQGFDVGPRKFRAHERVIGDRSVWTDTPADKARKAHSRHGDGPDKALSDQDRVAMEARLKRDEEILGVLSSDVSRKESLMSMHETERKRKAEEAEASGEAKMRRPFDRDTDLQVNKFDEAARKRMMKQSEGLSSRFSSGSTTAKFL